MRFMLFLFILLRGQRMVSERSVKGKRIRCLFTGQCQLGKTIFKKIVLTACFILGFLQYLDESTTEFLFEDVVHALGAEENNYIIYIILYKGVFP